MFILQLVRKCSEGYMIPDVPFIERAIANSQMDTDSSESDYEKDFMSPDPLLPKPRSISSRLPNYNSSESDTDSYDEDNIPLTQTKSFRL